MKKTTLKHVIIKLLKTSDRKNLKSRGQKTLNVNRETKIRICLWKQCKEDDNSGL